MTPVYLIPVVAYLFGSIPFGLLIVKLTAGRDIRDVGSGNIGAANVARNAGKIAGALTLVLDTAKGYLGVWIAAHLMHGNIRWMMIAAMCAVVGHIFPVWLKLRGGKGVATGLGVFIPISWHAVVLAVALWLIVVFFWHYASLGSIAAAAGLPIFMYVLYASGPRASGPRDLRHDLRLVPGTDQTHPQHPTPAVRRGTQD